MSEEIKDLKKVNQKYLDSLQERINQAFKNDKTHTEGLSK